MNGVRQDGTTSGANCTSITQSDIPFRIGKRIDAGGEVFFDGLIDEVQVFNRALTATEIAAIHAAGRAGKCQVGITAVGGTQQECAEKGGSTVTFSANALPPGLNIISSVWSVDGESIGPGDTSNTKSAFIPLGPHTIGVVATTSEGDRTGALPIEIVDTTEPEIAISFSDLSGQPVAGISRQGLNRVVVDFHATDVCDAEPSITAIGGVSVTSGEVVEILPARGQITLTGEEFAVTVTATDASGNVAQEDAVLPAVE